ncbi:MAG TPA: FixH family protein [Candidatus Baltobacteraceae bacterium]|nr:FixH family protein [Candidatus Baltobacteraceae bacterium]
MHKILVILVFALAACTSPHPDAVTQAQGHEVALYVTPGLSGENNDLRVEVRGARIPEISQALFTMPGMPAQPMRVPLADAGTGSYDAANVRFSMAGKWHVSVLERDAKGSHEFAAFDVTVR